MNYGYVRVSGDEQNLEQQLAALRQAGCRRGFIYTDRILANSYGERPQLQKCFSRLKPGDLLIVWRLDRLARNLRDLLNTATELQQRGVHLKALTEQLDTSKSEDSALQVFNAFAHFERTTLAERTAAGRQAARDRGQKFGRKPLLSAQQKASALKLMALGETSIRTAKAFSVSRSTLYRALRSIPRPVIAKPFKRKRPDVVSDTEILSQLIYATDPEVVSVLELEYGQTQAQAVDFVIEETGWRKHVRKWRGGKGTAQERLNALIEAARYLDAAEPQYHDAPRSHHLFALAMTPEVFRPIELMPSFNKQATAVDVLMKLPSIRAVMPQFTDGKGTAEERWIALVRLKVCLETYSPEDGGILRPWR